MKQKTVAISSTEAEYVIMSEATQEAIWLKTILSELRVNLEQVTMCNDNISSMQIIKNPTSHHLSTLMSAFTLSETITSVAISAYSTLNQKSYATTSLLKELTKSNMPNV